MCLRGTEAVWAAGSTTVAESPEALARRERWIMLDPALATDDWLSECRWW